MVVVKFRSNSDHEDLLKKVKKMKKFTEDIEECLEEAMEDEDYGFRGGYGNYRKDYDEDDMRMEEHRGYRYGSYRRGGM